MKVVAIIQARMGSTRLPGKVMLPLGDKTVLEHVIERTSRAKLVDETVVATTLKQEDLPVIKLVSEKGFRVFAGSEKDVLDRYYQCARLLDVQHIVRITADCPLIDPQIIDKVVERHLDTGADITYNDRYPDGFDVIVFTSPMLKRAWMEARLLSEREHVNPYMFKVASKVEKLVCPEDLYHVRLTLDREEDYEVLKRVFDNVYANNKNFSFEDVMDFLRKNPEVMKINSHIDRDEGFYRSLQEDKKLTEEEIERLT